MNKVAIHKLHQVFGGQDVHGHIQPFPFTQGALPSVYMDFAFTDVFLDGTGTENVIAFYKSGTDEYEFPGFFQGQEHTPDQNWFSHEHLAIALDDITFAEYIPADEYGCPNVRIYTKDRSQYCVYITSKIGME